MYSRSPIFSQNRSFVSDGRYDQFFPAIQHPYYYWCQAIHLHKRNKSSHPLFSAPLSGRKPLCDPPGIQTGDRPVPFPDRKYTSFLHCISLCRSVARKLPYKRSSRQADRRHLSKPERNGGIVSGQAYPADSVRWDRHKKSFPPILLQPVRGNAPIDFLRPTGVAPYRPAG